MRGLFVWWPSLGGVVGALVFLAAAFVPSLLPRAWYVQGGIGALVTALGYGAGAGLDALVRPIARRLGRGSDTSGRRARWVFLGVAAAAVVWVLVLHYRWQVDVRRLMGIDAGAGGYLAGAALVAPLGGYLLIVWGRAARAAFAAYRRLLGTILPRGWAWMAAVVTVLVAAAVFFDVVVAGRLLPALEGAYRASDERFDPDVTRPDTSLVTGGPGSVVDWARMGRQGRAFVSQAVEPGSLEAFSGRQALQPIRIYIGLQAADTPEERAGLAVDEMERTGAFQRSAIVLVLPTGSGWIDPYAVDPVEYMYDGDTAAVAIQYSYLASWMVMVGNQDLAIEAARALFGAVHDRLLREPESARPSLLLYGESLGAFGFERLFTGLDDVRRSADGVLWVGPPRSGPLWQRLVAERDPGSPVWRPVYRGGDAVRFGPDGESLAHPGAEWTKPRIAYLQHASDPITWWTPALLFDRPAWLHPPRGPDVSSRMPYVPIVTFWQVAVDLAMGTNAPPGHGHKFGIAQAEAWALIAPPDGWAAGDTRRLLDAVDR